MFDNYKRWSGVERFHGKVAELGPGNLTGVASRLVADGCSSVDLVDRFAYEPRAPQIGMNFHYGIAAEEFFRSHQDYEFIVSTAVMEHVYDPLQVLLAVALKVSGTMIHAVDCRDHGQFSDRIHDLSFLRISRLLYAPLRAAGGLNRIRLSAYMSACEQLCLNAKALITELSGLLGD